MQKLTCYLRKRLQATRKFLKKVEFDTRKFRSDDRKVWPHVAHLIPPVAWGKHQNSADINSTKGKKDFKLKVLFNLFTEKLQKPFFGAYRTWMANNYLTKTFL